MKKIYFSVMALFCLTACSNLEEADHTERKTFIRFYEGGNSYVATEAIQTSDGGYVIAGTIDIQGENPVKRILVIKTDRFGQKQWERIIDGGISNSITHITGVGFVLACDSVDLSPDSGEIANLENTSARVIILDDQSGEVDADKTFTEKITNDQGEVEHIDTHAHAVTQHADGGNLMVLGSRRRPKNVEYTTVKSLNPTTLNSTWAVTYDYLNRDYANTNSIFYTGDNLLWASNIKETLGNFTKSYVSVPRISGNSGFISSEYYGQNNEQLAMQILSLKPDGHSGFVATGRYAETDGTNSNMFFIKVDAEGKFKTESIRYFDFASGGEVDETTSQTQDSGNGITHTSDGGFLIAGNALKENGNDIWLVKLNSKGELQWSKTLGGRSNEEVSSVYETADRGFIICGTLQDGDAQTGGLSSIFLIKTDSQGELKN